MTMIENYWKVTKRFPNMENQEVVNEFLLSLKLANRSSRTIKAYKFFLEMFFYDMEEVYYSLSSEAIYEWLMKDHDRIKERTFRNRLSILSGFYQFCIKEEYIEHSPIKRRWNPRMPMPIPKYLEKKEIAKIRQQVEKKSLRDQVLIEFMLTTGCRVAEVNQLNRKDVDLETRTARIVGKGKKIRHVHFTDKCAVLLEKYIDSLGIDCEALFVTAKGTRLSIGGIQILVKRLGVRVGLVTSLHPHRFRHTFATELLGKGADLSFIGDELGHADLGTTQIYARLPNQKIIAQYRKFMG